MQTCSLALLVNAFWKVIFTGKTDRGRKPNLFKTELFKSTSSFSFLYSYFCEWHHHLCQKIRSLISAFYTHLVPESHLFCLKHAPPNGPSFFSPLPLCVSSDLPNFLPSLLHLFQLAFLLVDLLHSNPLYAFNTGLQRCLPIKEIWSCHSPAWRELPGGLIWILWLDRDFSPPASPSSSLPTSLPPLLLPGMLCSSHIKSLFPELAIFSLLPLHVVCILFSLTCHKMSSLSFNANSNESHHSLIHSLIQHNYFSHLILVNHCAKGNQTDRIPVLMELWTFLELSLDTFGILFTALSWQLINHPAITY